MGTDENLREAFAGESQANRRYLAFARKAEEEGLKNVAKLFRATAEAETVHAFNHIRISGNVKKTEENLKAAIEGERYESSKMYPKFMEEAKREGMADAERDFGWANRVERIHQGLYEKALESVKTGSDIKERDYYVCQTCGNTVEGNPPESCPICGRPRSQFKRVE